MDSDRTKDNHKARMDQADLCRRVELNLVLLGNGSFVKPKACFVARMEHLPLHLAYETCVCGPVQYRWILYERNHRTGEMQHFSKWFQAYVNDPTHGVSDHHLLDLAFGSQREYTSWIIMKDEVVPDEAYQNLEEIPVRLITKAKIPESLRSPAVEVDIVNAQLNQQNNTENKDESAEEDGTSEYSGSKSAYSCYSQDDE
ncbi:hypothetical protein PIB30_051854 [Stylosanthes scabra]|uniref:Uncharacterized protein n=1 Tax=Stylosanthes scabra TaxID=79078 RepID=A0ABU6RIP3_9FABA|nr:hypothetical protein [Stylosanthes scabra]